MPPPVVPLGDPLASSRHGDPLVYRVLGAVLHLDVLTGNDEARLAEANELLWNWFGSELKWGG